MEMEIEELRKQRDDAQIQLEELRQKLQVEQQQNKVPKSLPLSTVSICTNRLCLYLRA